jgi:lipopolysaccharide/colanic/teichoic acid biosynthesis glycosyltransferase
VPIFFKTWFERIVALAALVMFVPGFALIALFLRTNTDESILLTDDLVSSDGTHFRRYRFRTTGRSTSAFRSVGRFLRVVSIDDFPGLWAVARGRISLGEFRKLCNPRL